MNGSTISFGHVRKDCCLREQARSRQKMSLTTGKLNRPLKCFLCCKNLSAEKSTRKLLHTERELDRMSDGINIS